MPAKFTVCGLSGALSTMVSVPVRLPVVIGEKTTVIWQLVVGPGKLPQSLDSAKSPLTLTLEIVRGAMLALVKVTIWLVLVVPTT